MSGEARYLEWADRYGSVWAHRIAAVGDRFPLLWTQDGAPVHEDEVAGRPIASAAGAGHHVAGDPLAGLENLLASGAIYALGDLYHASGADRYRAAARRLAEPLVAELADPYADPAAAALCYYPPDLRRPFSGRGHSRAVRALRPAVATPPWRWSSPRSSAASWRASAGART